MNRYTRHEWEDLKILADRNKRVTLCGKDTYYLMSFGDFLRAAAQLLPADKAAAIKAKGVELEAKTLKAALSEAVLMVIAEEESK